MPRSKPYLYLRIGSYAVATIVLCLLVLFLFSSPLEPLVQVMALVFYTAAIATMWGLIRRHFSYQPETEKFPKASATDSADDNGANPPPVESVSQPAVAAPPATEQTQQPACLLLSKEATTTQAVEQCFAGWERELTVTGSCAEASQQLLNLLQSRPNLEEITLLIDTAGLEIDPVHLPALIKQDPHRVSLRLIAILDRQQNHLFPQLCDAGYRAFIAKPIEKSQLFSAISPDQVETDSDRNIVNLANYRHRPERLNRKRILVADKNSIERKKLASLLQDAGHRVKQVDNGEQALDALERQRYDIALINLQLPIMSGTQVIKLHRFTTPHPDWVSFIIMTDQTTPATLRICRELQVRACLFKPVPTDTLMEFINEAPTIATTGRAPIQQITSPPTPPMETQFLHADLLNISVLKGLENLDNDNDFVPDLIQIFNRDSSTILQRMEESVEFQDAKQFVELSNVLMDNAGQLGAFALYETCLGLQRMDHGELGVTLSDKHSRLRDLVLRTSQAFQHYLKQRKNQRSDQS